MLTVSPSISPLSYSSTFISPASVSICLTSEFVRVVNTMGGGGKTFRPGFTTVIDFEGESVLGFTTSLVFTSFSGGEGFDFFTTTGAVVLVAGFTAGGGFFTSAVLGAVVLGVVVFGAVVLGGIDLGGVVTTGGGIIHSRKVISSSAKSFPHPPGILSTMVKVREVTLAGVLNIARCCVQRGDSTRGTSPVMK